MSFVTIWMDLDITLSEVSWILRKTNIWYCLDMKSLKNDTNELVYETKIDSQA